MIQNNAMPLVLYRPALCVDPWTVELRSQSICLYRRPGNVRRTEMVRKNRLKCIAHGRAVPLPGNRADVYKLDSVERVKDHFLLAIFMDRANLLNFLLSD